MIRKAASLAVWWSLAGFAQAQTAGDLTVDQVIRIHAAVQQMNCRGTVIKDGAKESFACVPYSSDVLKPGLVWLIADVQTKAAMVRVQHDRALAIMRASLARRPDGNPTDEAAAKFEVQLNELLEKPAGVTLPHFKRAELEPLNLAPAVISALMPIVDQ